MINQLIKAIRSMQVNQPNPSTAYNVIIIHAGGTEVLRRELQSALNYDVVPPVVETIMGLRIMESDILPYGHFMLNNELHRYTKPSIDEMCQEALRRLDVALNQDVERHKFKIHRGFRAAALWMDLENLRWDKEHGYALS